MCVIDTCGAAPCQCFSPAGILTTSPARISSTGFTQSLNAAGAGRDDQDLAARMRVPRRAGARLERDRSATGVRGIERLEQHLDTSAAGEIVRRCRAALGASRRA